MSKVNNRRPKATGIAVVLPCLLVLAAASLAAERPSASAPPINSEGIATAPADLALPFHDGPLTDRTERMQQRAEAAIDDLIRREKARSYDDVGGDDVVIDTETYIRDSSIDIATDGSIYVAVEIDDTSGLEIRVYRSLDDGDNWTLWGELSQPDPVESYEDPCVHIAEGDLDACFVAFTRGVVGPSNREIRVAGSDLSLASGDFSTEVVAMNDPDTDLRHPHLTSDSPNYDTYYLYLVADGDDLDGGDIWFTRSTDRGASYETAYRIASLTSTDREYIYPTVSYGLGSYVHASWHFQSRTGGFDAAIRYRRASSDAGGGLGSWASIQYLSSTADEYFDWHPQVCASLTSNQVVIGYERRTEFPGGGYLIEDPGVFGSDDQGATFPHSVFIAGGLHFVDGLEQQPTSGDWILGGVWSSEPAYQRASAADITTWGEPQVFGDRSYYTGFLWDMPLALNPARDDRVAMTWTFGDPGASTDSLLFDAEWRSDEGYPNLEPGFPLDLPFEPCSEPAVVDLDGNGDLEIVYSDVGEFIQVKNHDGSDLGGWPVAVPDSLSNQPVAIGSLLPSGDLAVVVGTDNGLVYAYDSAGQLLPGWPWDSGYLDPVSVSIGAIAAPYPRSVIACVRNRVYFLNYAGQHISHLGSYAVSGGWIDFPAAIGDVDGDDQSEVVVGGGDTVHAIMPHAGMFLFQRVLPDDISDAVTLGDFDLDGDVEALAPTENGELYLLDDDGSDFPGAWPFASVAGFRMTSAAIASNLGGTEPEIAVANQSWTVHLLYANGSQQTGYPVYTGSGWWIFGAPTINRVEGYSADVIIGARDTDGWAWDNFGQLINGWPEPFADPIHLSAASGDLDLDGSTEIVFLTRAQLVVLDVNSPPNFDSQRWAMYAHDPQRTGCSDCPEDLVTGVGSGDEPILDDSGVTRVSFAAPQPNPISGTALFTYVVPARAQVRLEIYDLRGFRVRSVVKTENEPGRHLITWDGRGADGQRLASGQYLVRLRVRGQGVREDLTRKITVLR